MKGTHVIVHGRVQGVYFRDYTYRQAISLELTGWVRNLSDGTVEGLFFGKDDDIKKMLQWLETGSPSSKVDQIVSAEKVVEIAPFSFQIRY